MADDAYAHVVVGSKLKFKGVWYSLPEKYCPTNVCGAA